MFKVNLRRRVYALAKKNADAKVKKFEELISI